MKRTMIILALALVMVAMFATAAYAAGYKVDTYVTDPAPVVGPPALSIHGGYAATSTYCKSCHDVHGGTVDHANDAYLFRWATATDGCVACHDGASTLTTHKVYLTAGVQLSEHTISAATTVIPDSTADAGLMLDGVAGLGCADCHNAAPHGMGEGTLFVDGALIKATSGATVTEFCGTNCHNLNDRVGETTTHPMGAAEAVAYAEAPAASCISCHNDLVADGFPHESVNYAFLGTDAGTTDNVYQDGVCTASCHPNVGSTF